MEFKGYLKQLREAKKLSLRKLDDLSGVSHVYLSQIENGNRGIPSPDVLKKLAVPLGATYKELMQAAGYLGEDSSSVSTLEDEWPEVASVLRGSGKKMTAEERQRIARIIKAAIPADDEE
jgi:transcriptional regulator with XRE-family HTH domain